jgi:PAS domain S-box-containing protein
VAAPEHEGAGHRRHPLRFVWQMDADECLVIGSDEFLDLLGPRTAAAFGRRWRDIAADLGLDPDGKVGRALGSRATWSGIVVPWPADGASAPLPVELSGLPVFDRNRQFCGYRGFGVCRDLARLDELARARRIDPLALLATPAAAGEGAANVVPFRPAPMPAQLVPALSATDRSAIHELAREAAPPLAPNVRAADPQRTPLPAAAERSLLDRLPLGVLIYRHDSLRYANRTFLDWTGYDSLDALAQAGGLDSLFVESNTAGIDGDGPARPLAIATRRGDRVPVEGRLLSVPWRDGESALAIVLTNGPAPGRQQDAAHALREAQTDVRELEAILDTAADGVIVLDRAGRILAANSAAERLCGHAPGETAGRLLVEILTPDSERAASEHFDRVVRGARALGATIEVTVGGRDNRPVPLAMAVGRIGGSDRFCAVFRDLGPLKKLEAELCGMRRDAQQAAEAKAEFLAKVSHEIRTPLSAITGFAEVMMTERFGPIGNERYRGYLKDIHACGGHLVALLNDLLDLSRIDAGTLELTFANVGLNELIRQCVAIMQPQANRERIIIRTSLTPALPQIVGDARSVRQIVLNLLANAIKFTGSGGQVIVSTALSERGEAVLRVRDTGVGMSEKDIAYAFEPFRQVATAGSWGSGGIGLGLPLAKALAEANRAAFGIKSARNAGTLIEVSFPASCVLAE